MEAASYVVAVIDALQAANVPYMIVGSLSASAYGISRSTKDADAGRVKDREDVKTVLSVQRGKLDTAYLADWTSQHGTSQLLAQIEAEALES